jgi:ABC-type Zn uptake system ZnuABC Zn-binding protein ZnuA
MYKLLFLAAILINFPIVNAGVYHCTHPEVCRLAEIIIKENNGQGITLENIIIPSGDPHEFEPTVQDIKKLINAPNLLVGPQELNPWMKNISYIRGKNKNLKTFIMKLPDAATKDYPTKESESLGHFWLYPKIYCHFKNLLSNEMQFKKPILCDSTLIENKLSAALKLITSPIILTHDALLPLLEKLANNQNQIIAIKGSTHHGEVAASAVKKVYDALKLPKVIWIVETNIAISENIKSKIRKSDIVINIDTAKSEKPNQDFSILETLHQKLLESGHKP